MGRQLAARLRHPRRPCGTLLAVVSHVVGNRLKEEFEPAFWASRSLLVGVGITLAALVTGLRSKDCQGLPDSSFFYTAQTGNAQARSLTG